MLGSQMHVFMKSEGSRGDGGLTCVEARYKFAPKNLDQVSIFSEIGHFDLVLWEVTLSGKSALLKF